MQQSCFHCGEKCDHSISVETKFFCCEGCKQVYLLLNENGLCSYYDFEKNPGIKAKGKFLGRKFAYLDNQDVVSKLLRFKDGDQCHVQFYLPNMHCSSCIWLLENLHRINPGIISSKTNFLRKEIFIVFNSAEISLRNMVELLAFTGYEPDITLNDGEKNIAKKINRTHIFKIGIAGFCFSNIMMLSFPDYFASGNLGVDQLKYIFQYLSLALSLPVLLYSASEFFISGYKGLRQGWLNIDAPIALAILITFCRSVYEILSGTGPGYLDSMSGIVFFMLVGRWFQNRTYDAFSFDRNYRSYFPLGVTVISDGKEQNIPLSSLKKGDHILVRNEEMIPADAILKEGEAQIDYSFVSGENIPVEKTKGDLIYAGGRQMGTAISLEVVTAVSQSYITQLWNNDIFHQNKNREQSFIHPWSRYFTYTLFTVALATAIFWWINDPQKIWPAVTAVLIVACPCSLLLSATFTYGNMLSQFGKAKLYLKNSSVIESLRKVNTIIFDKTGTLTQHQSSLVFFEGKTLAAHEIDIIKTITSHSTHPLSKMISASLDNHKTDRLAIEDYREISGKGLEARINQHQVKLGSYDFIREDEPLQAATTFGNTGVHIKMGNQHRGRFVISNDYRPGLSAMADALQQMGYDIHILSGDNDQELDNLKTIFKHPVQILFRQTPQDKLEYIKKLQLQGNKVLMLGDGLNDAGALRQADVGLAVTEATNLFSPASDGILDGTMVHKLDKLMEFSKTSKNIVMCSFLLSIFYNIIGLSFATQGLLSPMIAAILMPASSISIVLFVSIYSKIASMKIQ